MATSITELELDGTVYPLRDEDAVRSITVGTTTTGGPDSAAKVENSGTDKDIILDFTVPQGPKGDTGETGKSATIAVGQVVTGRPGTDVMIVNAGNENHGIFDFTIPQGEKGEKGDTGEQGIQGETGVAATIEIGTVTTGAAGTTARVSNVGTETAAILNFTIPQGEKGDVGETGVGIASVEQTESSTASSGKNTMTVTLTNGVISTFDVYNGARGATGATGEKGEKGDKGDPGDAGSTGASGEAATVTVGETTTGNPGSDAEVTNSGTSTEAILNFTIPRGDQGEQGEKGDTGEAGEAATIDTGSVTLYDLETFDEDMGEPDNDNYPAYVINAGDSTNAIFSFYLPKGNSATIEVGSVIFGDELSIVNSGTKSNALFDFTFPQTLAPNYDADTKTLIFTYNEDAAKISAFAIYSEDDDSLIFYANYVIPTVGSQYRNKTVTKVYRQFDTASYSIDTSVPWYDERELIKSIAFDSSFMDIYPVSLAYWFYGCAGCSEIDLQNLNTTSVVAMDYAFAECSALISLDISSIETNKLDTMSGMFQDCTKLQTIYSNDNIFVIPTDDDGNSSTDIMFDGCESLIGGNGTTYNEEQIDASMAHIDTEDNPGYFTAK